ncbi:MAG: hypothetical protein V1834_03315, partial [Candidatus Micrarchaeota archaeon]
MNFKLVATGIFLLLAVLVSFVAGSTLEFQESVKQGCQCDAQTFTAILSNDGASGELYAFSIDYPQGFSGFVTPNLEVPPHSSDKATVILTPHCDQIPGEYPFVVTAKGNRGSLLKLTGTSIVDECHYLQLETSASQTVCGGVETQYGITLKNSGVFPEKGSLTTDLSSGYYTLAPSSFDLQPGENQAFKLFFNVPASTPPQDVLFKITAASEYTYRDAFATLKIADCSGMIVDLPDGIEVQPGEPRVVDGVLTNTGIADTFDLNLDCPSFASLDKNSVSLNEAQQATVKITLNPDSSQLNKNFKCTLIAKSRKYLKQYSDSMTVSVKQLYSTDITPVSSNGKLAGDSVTICKGEDLTVSFNLKNYGKQATYALSAQGLPGSLSASSLALGVSETKQFSFNAKAGDLQVGSYSLLLTASNQFTTASKSMNVKVENCFDSGLSLSQSALDICAGEELSASFDVRNKGTREDSFDLTAASKLATRLTDARITVPSLSSVSAKVFVKATRSDAPGDYSVSITAKDGSTSTVGLPVTVLTDAKCHALGLSLQDGKGQVEVCKGISFELTVSNNGRFTEELDVLVEGVAWAFSTPSTIILTAGETKSIYVFASPPFNTPKGEYDLKVTVSGEYSSATADLVV